VRGGSWGIKDAARAARARVIGLSKEIYCPFMLIRRQLVFFLHFGEKLDRLTSRCWLREVGLGLFESCQARTYQKWIWIRDDDQIVIMQTGCFYPHLRLLDPLNMTDEPLAASQLTDSTRGIDK
jgi:hypothetical protein